MEEGVALLVHKLDVLGMFVQLALEIEGVIYDDVSPQLLEYRQILLVRLGLDVPD